jgi:hypothetical protein
MRAVLVVGLAAAVLSGCGRDAGSSAPATTQNAVAAAATKNTTRLGGASSAETAAAVARAVYPAASAAGRPAAVTLADGRDWRAALAASVLMAPPIRAPVLLGDGDRLPAATAQALAALQPEGAAKAEDAQVVRVGRVARPKGLRSTDLVGADAFELARAIDAFQASARGASADHVVVVSADDPAFAMPAAGWAAKSGDPILFAHRDALPAATRRALAAHQQPRIYVLGPSKVIGPKVTRELRRLGTVVRVGGADPVANAIAFARFSDGAFGWNVTDPGHGLVFANPGRPADAAAAAPLSSSGQYGPLLLTAADGSLPGALADYLLDIQPGFSDDPARGVYNHGWIAGDGRAVSSAAQARIDTLLEIAPVDDRLPSQP